MRFGLIIGMCLGLGACSSADFGQFRTQVETLDLIEETKQAFAASYQTQPFENGTVHIVAEEHGDLHTYSLTPCGGDHICGPSGRAGHVQIVDGYHVVTGAYAGRTFHLSPGGDGILTWRGVNRVLAWN